MPAKTSSRTKRRKPAAPRTASLLSILTQNLTKHGDRAGVVGIGAALPADRQAFRLSRSRRRRG
ncbi:MULTISPECIES: hypothetical protein [Rhodopseudomonas]|uniref:hypothetical protein n=1 Tax=Rhodopseudomonas TaxID=1073 RepID=UPI00142D25E7|nr:MULTISPECIES: hypothetical protein [Rhodopseudomonas]